MEILLAASSDVLQVTSTSRTEPQQYTIVDSEL
jgi:hypothetical protein